MINRKSAWWGNFRHALSCLALSLRWAVAPLRCRLSYDVAKLRNYLCYCSLQGQILWFLNENAEKIDETYRNNKQSRTESKRKLNFISYENRGKIIPNPQKKLWKAKKKTHPLMGEKITKILTSTHHALKPIKIWYVIKLWEIKLRHRLSRSIRD